MLSIRGSWPPTFGGEVGGLQAPRKQGPMSRPFEQTAEEAKAATASQRNLQFASGCHVTCDLHHVRHPPTSSANAAGEANICAAPSARAVARLKDSIASARDCSLSSLAVAMRTCCSDSELRERDSEDGSSVTQVKCDVSPGAGVGVLHDANNAISLRIPTKRVERNTKKCFPTSQLPLHALETVGRVLRCLLTKQSGSDRVQHGKRLTEQRTESAARRGILRTARM